MKYKYDIPKLTGLSPSILSGKHAAVAPAVSASHRAATISPLCVTRARSTVVTAATTSAHRHLKIVMSVLSSGSSVWRDVTSHANAAAIITGDMWEMTLFFLSSCSFWFLLGRYFHYVSVYICVCRLLSGFGWWFRIV